MGIMSVAMRRAVRGPSSWEIKPLLHPISRAVSFGRASARATCRSKKVYSGGLVDGVAVEGSGGGH
jgi:hypothetical protein